MRCSCGATPPPAAGARHGQRDRRVPAPARLEHRRVEERLHQHVAGRLRMQIAEHVGERERVLRAERQQQRVLGRGRLQLEVELPAEPLAQRQAPRLVDAAAERRVQHQLHAARLVEEPLEHERLLRRDGAERAPAFGEVRHAAARPPRGVRPVSATSHVGRPTGRRRRAVDRHRARRSLTARDSSSLRAGASPSQNGMVGGAPLRVGDAHGAARDLQDPPRRVAELEDVAGGALDREVLVQRADERLVRDRARRGSRRPPESRRRRSARAAARRAGRARCRALRRGAAAPRAGRAASRSRRPPS